MSAAPKTHFVIVWEFRPRADKRAEFEQVYGPQGVWSEFFRHAQGYVRTELVQDKRDPLRYFTFDVWVSPEDYQRFRQENVTQYGELDRQCEALTDFESKIGEFDNMDTAQSAAGARLTNLTLKGEGLVRPATSEDVPAMIALELRAATAAHWTESSYREVFQPEGPQRIALVISDGETKPVRGFLVARIVASDCELENIVIDASLQRRGFGSQLIATLIRNARERGLQSIFLEVRGSNNGARALYEKCGFRVAGRRRSYYSDPAEDAIAYAIRL